MPIDITPEIQDRLRQVTPGQKELFERQLRSSNDGLNQAALNRLGFNQDAAVFDVSNAKEGQFFAGSVVAPFTPKVPDTPDPFGFIKQNKAEEGDINKSLEDANRFLQSGDPNAPQQLQEQFQKLGLQAAPLQVPGGINATTFDPTIASPIVRNFDADLFSPDLQTESFNKILDQASRAGIDITNEANLERLKMEAKLTDLNNESLFNSRKAQRGEAAAQFNLQFETAMIESARNRALDGQEISNDEARSISEYMFKRVEDLSADNIVDMKSAKEKETRRARRLLGRGVDDVAGVQLITDLAGQYDDKISRLRRDRDTELTRIATSAANQERGFALARANIESTAIESMGRIRQGYIQRMNEIEDVFEGNAVAIRSEKRNAVIESLDNTMNVFKETKREEREMEMWNLAFSQEQIKLQQAQQNLIGTRYQEVNGQILDTQKNSFITPEEFDAKMLTANYKNFDKVSLFGQNGILTSTDGESPYNPEGLDVDFGPLGAPVPTLISGTVIDVKGGSKSFDKRNGGWGNTVLIRDDRTGQVLRISHLDDADIASKLKIGQKFNAGDIVGGMGNTGSSIAGPGGNGGHVDYTLYSDDSLKQKLSARHVLAIGLGKAPQTIQQFTPEFYATEKGQKIFDKETSLRKELVALSKEFIDIKSAYGRIQASGQEPSAAGDLALIFNYMKMLDPGSTVREGEFANAQNAGGVGDKLISRYNNAMRGERLSKEQRQDFLTRSEMLFNNTFEKQSERNEVFMQQAKNLGGNPESVVPGFLRNLDNDPDPLGIISGLDPLGLGIGGNLVNPPSLFGGGTTRGSGASGSF